ncbi:hypothetical protein K474DRAFT_1655101 [Panus rudis PR-1116 ss-1]|nr:hypothetical protein K474DRAFT_1655101 [Panus rudis PR-1116 ss-1]
MAVIQFAKKTGDYSVLSHADICVLALTHGLNQKYKQESKASENSIQVDSQVSTSQNPPQSSSADTQLAPFPDTHKVLTEPQSATNSIEKHVEEPPVSESESSDEEAPEGDEGAVAQEVTAEDMQEREKLDVEIQRVSDNDQQSPLAEEPHAPAPKNTNDEPIYEDPSDIDDGEGEWITPSNVALHKSKALHLVPDDDPKKVKGKKEQIGVGCMTADFAMQNVLLQMGLNLVGVEGKKIEKVKTWVLRCHACFKICKDNARKFCPSCGNPTLLRASVTLSSPNATSSTPTLQVHLKKNFQYKTRGTVYSIPAPKPGSAKTGAGEGLILREDQSAWMKAKKHADGKREREEKRLLASAAGGQDGKSSGMVVSSWMDPDWVPEILSVGAGGKGRSMRHRGYDGDMPVIGYGKKNPNERRSRKK